MFQTQNEWWLGHPVIATVKLKAKIEDPTFREINDIISRARYRQDRVRAERRGRWWFFRCDNPGGEDAQDVATFLVTFLGPNSPYSDAVTVEL